MIQLKVNGIEQSFGGEPEMPLLWYLRDVLGLTGSKFGCGVGLCGACTVHVNGQATRSCVTTMTNAAGKEVTTVEGLGKNGLHPVQKAWMQINVPQCGYCQVGQIFADVLHSLAASEEIAWTLYAAVAATANGFHFFTCEMLEKEVCHGSQEKSARPRGFTPSVSRAGSKN